MKIKSQNKARREVHTSGSWAGWDFDSTKLPEPPKPNERDIFRPKGKDGVFEFNPKFS